MFFNFKKIYEIHIVCRVLAWFILATIFIEAYILICRVVNFRNTEYTISKVGSIIFISFFVYLAFPKIGLEIKNEFIKSPSIYVVILPLIIALFENLITSSCRLVPLLFGSNSIGIGSKQQVGAYGAFTFTSLFTAIIEEIIFRFSPYIGLKLLLKYISVQREFYAKIKFRFINLILVQFEKLYDSLFVAKKSRYTIVWLIITSTIFSLMHGPNINNFYAYFIPGMLFGWLYIKYGLFSAMVCHMFSNYLSPPLLDFVIWIFSFFVNVT